MLLDPRLESCMPTTVMNFQALIFGVRFVYVINLINVDEASTYQLIPAVFQTMQASRVHVVIQVSCVIFGGAEKIFGIQTHQLENWYKRRCFGIDALLGSASNISCCIHV